MINGSALKHNFLKQITFRMDYKGLLDSDVEKSVILFRQALFDNGFVSSGMRTENQVDLQVKIDLNLPEENPLSVSSATTSQVYVFQSADQKKTIEVSKSFMTLQIMVDLDYKSFDEYIDILVLIISSLKSQSPFFRSLRLGLRKINLCFVDSLEKLNDYFVNGAFNIPETMNYMSDYACKASNLLTIIEKDAYHVNYVRNLQEGITQQQDGISKVVYQIVLDIDVYCDDIRQIGLMIENSDKVRDTLVQQNSIAFECYTNSLTTEFIEQLNKDEFDDSHIMEVL